MTSADDADTALVRLKRKATQWLQCLVILSSIASGVFGMVTDIRGAVAAWETLYGYDNTERGNTVYESGTIQRFLKMRIRDHARQIDQVASAVAAGQRIMYLEPDEDDPTEYAVVYGNCSSLGGYQDGDRLYADWHMLPLLQRVLVGMNSSIDLSADPATHVAVVDCAYSGRVFQDTSMFKGYLVDVNLTTMMSFALQTMNGLRESTRMESQVGPVVVSTADLDEFAVGPADAADADLPLFGLRYNGASAYQTLLAFDFPYEPNSPFHLATAVADDKALRLNQWHWRVRATNEVVVMNGFSGYYRGNKDAQTNFVRYVLSMDNTPVRDFAVDDFYAQGHYKDSRAWIHALGTVAVAVRIAFPTMVAGHVAAASLSSSTPFWLPDAGPYVVRQLYFRSVWIMFTWIVDRFWIVHEWALTVGFARYDLEPMVSPTAVIQSDCLAFFVVLTDLVASVLHVPVLPAVPVLLFALSYHFRETIVQSLTSAAMETAVATYMEDLYMRNLVAYSPTTMDIWTLVELTPDDPPQWLVMREFAWYFAPCLVMVTGLVGYKLIQMAVTRGRRGRVAPTIVSVLVRPSPQSIVDTETHTLKYLADFHSPPNTGARGVVSTLPTPQSLLDMAGPLYVNSMFQLPKASLWAAGWVLVDRRFLVRITDLPNLFLNSLHTSSVSKVYCCLVDARQVAAVGSGPLPEAPPLALFLTPRLVPLPPAMLSLSGLWHLSLETLWVEEIPVCDDHATTIHRVRQKGSPRLSIGQSQASQRSRSSLVSQSQANQSGASQVRPPSRSTSSRHTSRQRP